MSDVLPWLVAGTALLVLRRFRVGGALGIALAPGLGFGVLSLTFFCWRLLGLSSGSFRPAAWPGLLLVGVLAALGLRGTVTEGAPRTEARRGWRLAAVALAGAAVVAYFGVAFLLHSWQSPVGQFDAWAIWTSRARLLFRAEDAAEAFGLLRRPHPDYPLLLPGSLAAQFALRGDLSAAVPRWTGALLAAGAAGIVAVGVRTIGGDLRWAGAATMVLLSTPLWIYWSFSQCADVPLAYLLAAGALALALHLRAGAPTPVPAALAGLLAGLPAWTKNEGMILSLILLGLFGLRAAVRRRWGLLGRVLTGAAVPWACLLAFKLLWKPKSDLSFFFSAPWKQLAQAERWRYVGMSFLERLDPVGGFASWGAVWVLALAALAMAIAFGATGRPETSFLLTLVGCCWIAWFAVFVATPHDVTWHVRTALDRLMIQLLPLTLMAGFGGVAVARRRPT